MPWLPTIESLKKRLKSTPKLLKEFFRPLFSPKNSHHLTSESTEHITVSFTKDLKFGITRSTFLTLKHTLLGLGLHNIVGQKLIISSFFCPTKDNLSTIYQSTTLCMRQKLRKLSSQNVFQKM